MTIETRNKLIALGPEKLADALFEMAGLMMRSMVMI